MVDQYETVETEIIVPIEKIDEEKRNFFGWAHVQVDDSGVPVVDNSGDFVKSPEALAVMEDSVYRYVQDEGSGDIGHRDFKATRLIESIYMTPEKRDMMGITKGDVPEFGWWLGFHMPEPADASKGDAFEKVKSGELGALSIVGSGRRRRARTAA